MGITFVSLLNHNIPKRGKSLVCIFVPLLNHNIPKACLFSSSTCRSFVPLLNHNIPKDVKQTFDGKRSFVPLLNHNIPKELCLYDIWRRILCTFVKSQHSKSRNGINIRLITFVPLLNHNIPKGQNFPYMIFKDSGRVQYKYITSPFSSKVYC